MSQFSEPLAGLCAYPSPFPQDKTAAANKENDIFLNCRVLASRDRPRPRTAARRDGGFDGAQNFGRSKLLKMFGCRFLLCKLSRSPSPLVGYIFIQAINLQGRAKDRSLGCEKVLPGWCLAKQDLFSAQKVSVLLAYNREKIFAVYTELGYTMYDGPKVA